MCTIKITFEDVDTQARVRSKVELADLRNTTITVSGRGLTENRHYDATISANNSAGHATSSSVISMLFSYYFVGLI